MSLLFHFAPRSPRGAIASIDIAASASVGLPAPAMSDEPSDDRTEHQCLDDARVLTRILLSNGNDEPSLAVLEAGLDEYVDVWTPAVHISSRLGLMSALADADDAISDVHVAFTDAASSARTALMAWLATGRFVRPAFLDDDHFVEPDGSVIQLAGVTSMSFTTARRAERIRCYYDRLTLIEQLIRPPVPGVA